MYTCTSKVLFLHDLDSSRESTKFHAIQAAQKFCIDIDYRNLTYLTVDSLYSDIIQKIKPEILIGHSLGAYWALKMSIQHKIPAIIANPSLHPDFRPDYCAINDNELENDIPQIAYIELGDEVLNMHAVMQQIEPHMQVQVFEGGHHRLARPDNLNHLIEYVEQQFLKK